MFNWKQFLVAYKIEFIEHGPNVSRGNCNIKCPWCGESDVSYHLGISLNGKGFGCWRNTNHRGKNPRRLVQALLQCSYDAAQQIVDGSNTLVLLDERSFIDQVNSLFGNNQPIPYLGDDPLDFTNEMRLIQNIGLGKFFFDYIKNRGYTANEAYQLIEDYKLHYAVRGAFSYRVIIPVIMEQGLVTWTSRAITDNTLVRYKTLSVDKEKAESQSTPRALISIKDTLWNYKDLLDNPENKLVVCEGPFDAMRVDFFGKEQGVRATCLFSKTISSAQYILLDELSYLYKDKVLLLDQDATFDYLWIMDNISWLGFKSQILPKGVKDPAELDQKNILAL
jgi:hypothetical protein